MVYMFNLGLESWSEIDDGKIFVQIGGNESEGWHHIF